MAVMAVPGGGAGVWEARWRLTMGQRPMECHGVGEVAWAGAVRVPGAARGGVAAGGGGLERHISVAVDDFTMLLCSYRLYLCAG